MGRIISYTGGGIECIGSCYFMSSAHECLVMNHEFDLHRLSSSVHIATVNSLTTGTS
jgi:hypothetical protein